MSPRKNLMGEPSPAFACAIRLGGWSGRSGAIGLLGMLIGMPAHAYLGPGAGLGMIGSLIAIVFVLLVIVLGLVIYPIRRLRRRKSKTVDPESRVDD
jgi:hypothetical protein